MKTLPNNIFSLGHVGVSKYNPTIMRFMQMATIFGAGGFGLIHLFKPELLKTLLGAPQNSLMLGDMFVGSVFTAFGLAALFTYCLLYTSPSPRDRTRSRMPSSA